MGQTDTFFLPAFHVLAILNQINFSNSSFILMYELEFFLTIHFFLINHRFSLSGIYILYICKLLCPRTLSLTHKKLPQKPFNREETESNLRENGSGWKK